MSHRNLLSPSAGQTIVTAGFCRTSVCN